MRVARYRLQSEADILTCLARLSPRTVILDVEPLVAYWNTDEATLDIGISHWLAQLSPLPRLEAVVFATNSPRRPSARLSDPSVTYLATAFKPLRTSPFRKLPLPGALVGDQVATDGLLAWRLRYTFIHYHPQHHRTPIGVRLMHALGLPLDPLLFHKNRAVWLR